MNASTKSHILLSKSEAKNIMLHAQGLGSDTAWSDGKDGVLQAIRRLGYIQLDTLSVVARSHHHTLWTRTPGYKEHLLEELMKEKKVFEYWSHAAAYLPMEDYRYSLVRKNEFKKGRRHWFDKDKKITQYVLEKIKSEGPLQSRDFETDKKRGSWFDWKPAKIALEQLFHEGNLMVKERKGFQKVYDITERVLPNGIDTTMPTIEEYAHHLILTNLRAHGLVSIKDITHLRKGITAAVQKVLKKMLKEGLLVPVSIDSVNELYYRLGDDTIWGEVRCNTTILSPFDNVVIRRDRLKQVFDYDFMLECYLPEHKRKYGYFCLPVLYGNEFIGKFDPKADRATGTFYVKQFYVDKQIKDPDAFHQSFAPTLKAFAAFNDCNKIVIEKTSPGKLKAVLKKLL